MWAERRTTITRDGIDAPDVEAVSLWVHLDPASWRPVPFDEAEVAAYGDAAAGRRITARLRHPAPAPQAPAASTWYYCQSSKSFYPYVTQCAEGWKQVPATPPK